VFVGGAIIQWLRDSLGFFAQAADSETLANSVESTEGVYVVPALTGLGAPHWEPHARGTMVGLTRGTTTAHITRAALEGIAYQVRDLLIALEADSEFAMTNMRVDGGAAVNNFLMQFQADILQQVRIIRPEFLESSALGVAYFAGLAGGLWSGVEELQTLPKREAHFTSAMEVKQVDVLIKGWEQALRCALSN